MGTGNRAHNQRRDMENVWYFVSAYIFLFVLFAIVIPVIGDFMAADRIIWHNGSVIKIYQKSLSVNHKFNFLRRAVTDEDIQNAKNRIDKLKAKKPLIQKDIDEERLSRLIDF